MVLDASSQFFFGTEPGTTAFLPGVVSKDGAKVSWDYHVFGRDGPYSLPRQQECWFVINHRDTSEEEGAASYVAVKMILFRDYEFNEPLRIYRNKGWIRKDSNINAEKIVEKNLSKSVNKFLELHGGENLSKLDEFLGIKWYAIARGSEEFSWDKRPYWENDFSKISDGKNRFISRFESGGAVGEFFSHQSYLLRFRSMHKKDTKRPLIFHFDCLNADHVWLQTLSPTLDSHQYYLTIQEK
uniref:Uncharacterized protein n=1 Tax=Candidatus Kentrum sp. LPFa TaxID=2126335 RepID=A0A450X9V5_9GAMM|nr:MAG: hypothetical protein BECKLPF1236A_GA0070988_1003014 [Candidatus Kentron sp. LPFa]VFK26048.1 MAG: hypothetical protein BECKLPF1236C_GA0070990_1002914 [Candidatus Kentron sp. LPFa]